MVIASPAGAYFKGGVKPVTLWLTEEYTRAGRGGMGAAKTGGNYASSLLAAAGGHRAGCDQVVFLDGEEGKYVEELGGMNMYFVYDDGRIVTPATGTILEGITRGSIIELAGKMGHQVEERKFSIDEWREGVTSGEITEIFACGTAAVVTPVGELKWDGGSAPAPAVDRPDLADPPGAGRRPVRPRRRHLRLDAPDRLTCNGRRGRPIRVVHPAGDVRPARPDRPRAGRPRGVLPRPR